MKIQLLTIDLICDAEGMPYRAIGHFVLTNEGNEFRVNINTTVDKHMSMEELKLILFTKAEAQMKIYEHTE